MAGQKKRYVSNMGSYQGYSEPVYDGYQKTSEYIPMPDGCRLAVDIYRPTKNGVLHQEPLPLLWCATQYRRAEYKADGTITDLKESAALWFTPGAADLLYYGYIIAAVDVRGSGASFGHGCAQTPTLQELYDVFECNEWLAALPYTTHETGMFGISYLGSCQWMTAMMGAPSLKCIVPTSAPWDNPYLRINGIDNLAWTEHVDEGLYEKNVLNPSPPVDEDTDGSLRAAAAEEHKGNPHTFTLRQTGYYFDDTLPYYNSKVYWETYYGNFYHNVNQLGVACYIIEGLRDFLVTDAYDWFNNLTVPKRLSVGPWDHSSVQSCDNGDFNFTTEMLRWYDYWLKGIDNGIMFEDPVHIYNYGAEQWLSYPSFPVPGVKNTDFYFQSLHSGTVQSVNDGSLTTRPPRADAGQTRYTVDYTISKRGFEDRNFYSPGRSCTGRGCWRRSSASRPFPPDPGRSMRHRHRRCRQGLRPGIPRWPGRPAPG